MSKFFYLKRDLLSYNDICDTFSFREEGDLGNQIHDIHFIYMLTYLGVYIYNFLLYLFLYLFLFMVMGTACLLPIWQKGFPFISIKYSLSDYECHETWQVIPPKK